MIATRDSDSWRLAEMLALARPWPRGDARSTGSKRCCLVDRGMRSNVTIVALPHLTSRCPRTRKVERQHSSGRSRQSHVSHLVTSIGETHNPHSRSHSLAEVQLRGRTTSWFTGSQRFCLCFALTKRCLPLVNLSLYAFQFTRRQRLSAASATIDSHD